MSIFDGQDDPLELDTIGEVMLFATAVAVVGVFLGALYVSVNPMVDEQIRYQLLQNTPDQSGENIQFSEGQVREMNKVYREKTVEYAWCLNVQGEEVEEMRHASNITFNDRMSIHFKCSRASTNGILHTHPGLFSVPELSQTDKQSLLNGSLEVSCVLSEAVPPRFWDQDPPSLNCFNRDLEELEVRIQGR